MGMRKITYRSWSWSCEKFQRNFPLSVCKKDWLDFSQLLVFLCVRMFSQWVADRDKQVSWRNRCTVLIPWFIGANNKQCFGLQVVYDRFHNMTFYQGFFLFFFTPKDSFIEALFRFENDWLIFSFQSSLCFVYKYIHRRFGKKILEIEAVITIRNRKFIVQTCFRE